MANHFNYTYTSRAGRITRGASLCCSKCNQEIEPGVPVVSIGSARRHRKIYHQACYESLYIETKDDTKETKQ
ncbi:hypothetical protein [Candidatus Bathycorpusculum sp.]|uniref:hypothetical protein n=1 Tax=Candidatus Bathycorpusculum sp. TaxID=2994959 RepID=UPI002827A5F9|nr:hypothetical protein [Candidatus Termitimicrobium sp.]MCL2432086.1 hypothetical protein [Candidatus Termitimicrobium sp.]